MSAPFEVNTPGDVTRGEADGFRGRILLVVGSEEGVGPIVAILRSLGGEIETAVHAATALARHEANRFDLIVMEMEMPVQNGYEAARRIRALEAAGAHSRVPILALIAGASREPVARCFDAGCDGYAAIPVEERALTEAVRCCTDDLRVEPDSEIADLLPDYLEHRRSDVDALWEAIGAESWEPVRRLGHDMKGSGTLYGLPRVSEIGARLEAAAKRTDRGAASQALSSLESFVVRVARQAGVALAPPPDR